MTCVMFWIAAVRDMIDLAHALISSFMLFAERIVAEQACSSRSVLLVLRFSLDHLQAHVAVHCAVFGSVFEQGEVARRLRHAEVVWYGCVKCKENGG